MQSFDVGHLILWQSKVQKKMLRFLAVKTA
jgi:hypothetical protein